MKIVSRYILKEFTRLLGLVLASLAGIYLLVEFFERVDDFVEHNASLFDSLLYFVYKLPLIIYQITPIAILFPTILLISRLIRTGEITAVKTAGVSIFRLAAPLVAVGLILGAFLFFWGDFVVAPSLRKLDYLYQVKIKGEGSEGVQWNDLWVKTGQNDIWNITRFIPAEEVMEGVVVYAFERNKALRMRVDARRVRKEGGGWNFEKAYVRSFVKGQIVSTRFYEKISLPFEIALSDLTKKPFDPDRMSYWELRRKVRQRRAAGLGSTIMAVDMHSKLSYPIASLVMVLLGIPFSLRWERGGKTSWGILLGISIGVIYWLLYFAFIALGQAGLLPPIPASWGANILLTLWGMFMMLGAD